MSIRNIDVIDRLPFELAAILQQDEFFCDIPVVVVESGNVALEMERAQAVITSRNGKRGVAVVVPQLTGDDAYPEVKFGPLILRPSVQIVENVELNNDANGTKKSYRKVLRRIIQVIKATRLDGLTSDFKLDTPGFHPVPFKDTGKQVLGSVVGGQVNFVTYEQDDEELCQVSVPAFVLSDDKKSFTITCATDCADIYFTTDTTVPMPLAKFPGTNKASTAQLFAGDPVAIPDGCSMVRAAAFKKGFIGSIIGRTILE